VRILTENKRVHFDFKIIERFTAGVVLTGHETKSVKTGRAQIAGAHIIIRGNEAFVVGMEIPSFQPKNAPEDYDPGRTKKLLLNKSEIASLLGKIREGLAVVPLRVFEQKRRIKLDIALARGIKKYDRREILKKREAERDIRKVAGRSTLRVSDSMS